MLTFEKPKFPVVIRRADRGMFTFYSFEDKKVNIDGKKEMGRVPCRFRKGVEINDKTIIYIDKAYLDWYKKGYEYKPVVFITEYSFDNLSQEERNKNEALTNYKNELKDNYDFEDFKSTDSFTSKDIVSDDPFGELDDFEDYDF